MFNKLMKYIVYLTTNVLNNKIYVGVHQTENPDVFDGYLGNGLSIQDKHLLNHPKEPFHFAVKKYGFSAFRRSTIQIFETLREALDLEEVIVDEDFVKRPDTYNVTVGGEYPPILKKTIYQYDLQGNFIQEWPSIVQAAAFFKCDSSCIGQAVLHSHTSNGYLWADYKVDKLNTDIFTVYSPKKPVFQYNSFGEFIASYESINSAARSLNVRVSNIQRSLKLGYRTKGFYFSFELKSNFSAAKTARFRNMPIHQYSLTGEFIKSYSSMKAVEEDFGCRMDGINSSIRMGTQYKGFQWSREKVEALKPLTKQSTAGRKVGQYTLDGNLVRVYNTVRECRKDFANVSKVLKGEAKHCKGYTFKYIN